MIRKIIVGMVLLVGVCGLFPVLSTSALKSDAICDKLTNAEQREIAGCGMLEETTVFDRVPGALMAVFSVVGIVAVAMIIFGGVRYSISQGDPGKVKKAKDTIMYAVIGLVVTLSAFAITGFILSNTGGSSDAQVTEDSEDGE